MEDIGRAFITKARALLLTEYLPKIERCLEQLSDTDVWWRANAESNSIGNLLLHLQGNARQWIISGVGGATDRRVRQQEFDERAVRPAAELLADLSRTLHEVDEVLDRLQVSRLLEQREIQGHRVTILEAVFHVVEHFAMHTGQVISLTKMLTNRDLAFYDFSGGEPRQHWHK